jgi:hypothetical protein
MKSQWGAICPSSAPEKASKKLSGGKEVFVSIVHGLEDGARVFFLDISIRE